MKNCQNKVKHTCGDLKNYATCIQYELELPTFSELEGCVTLEETTEELYNLVGEIKEDINLVGLGNGCLTYADKKPKTVILKLEQEICLLKARVLELEQRPLCNLPLSDCVDTSGLTDPCGDEVNTFGQLLQILVNNVTP